MEPLSVALDVLQGDKHVCLRFVLPTLYRLKSKLNAVHLTLSSLFIQHFSQVRQRFVSIMNDTEFLLVAVTHLKFKLDTKVRSSMLFSDAVSETPIGSAQYSQEVTQTSSVSSSNVTETVSADNFFDDIDHSSSDTDTAPVKFRATLTSK